MKPHLLYRDRDFDLRTPLPWNSEALVQDLELDTLFGAMAQGDKFVLGVVKAVVLTGPQTDLDTIGYRQEVLQDCLNNPAVIRELYAVAVEAAERDKKHYLGSLTNYPDWVLRWSLELIQDFLDLLKQIHRIEDRNAERFSTPGWINFFSMLQEGLSDDYCSSVEAHLRQLRFPDGIMLSAELGPGNKGSLYILHPTPRRKGNWLTRLFTPQPPTFGFSLHPRDEGGARALSELKNQGISIAATALGESADHVRNFFGMLRTELAFYIGCLNLREELARRAEPLCLPVPRPADERRLSFQGLYDPCLALKARQRVVGNDGNADGKTLVIITGANTGGKSTFLRSVGLAQLMMQCGMFVAADSFSSNLCDGILTHHKREEDTGLQKGKFDEELSRMSQIVDHLTPHSLVLFNESFAATNEHEGSEIAKQIVSALLEDRVRMLFVTHLFEFADAIRRRHLEEILFLRADRQVGGARSFKLREGEPLQTSFGEDLYDRIFGTAPSSLAVENRTPAHGQ